MKIVLLDGYACNPGDISWDGFREFGELEVYDRTPSELVYERAKDAEIIITNKVPFDQSLMERLPQLRYIGVLATGYNIIDTEYARKQGIVVTNIPAYSTDGVAQMVFAQLLTIINRVEHYTLLNRQGRWSRNPDFCYWDEPIMEITGKTMGIVGLGNIGMKVAKIALAFGMKVCALTSKKQEVLPQGICKVTLDELLAKSHVVSLHCPLTQETQELINKERIGKMRNGAILINTGRGPLVNENDVAEALTAGRLTAYGTDVLCKEPPAADNPLLKCQNAFVTPHVAWAATETRARLAGIAVDNLRAFLQGRPRNVVSL